MKLTPITHTINPSWSINKSKKTIVVEMSDLNQRHLYSRLYDDACDVGLAIRNPKTDSLSIWYLADEILDADNDLVVTIFKPTEESIRKNPEREGWEFHVLND